MLLARSCFTESAQPPFDGPCEQEVALTRHRLPLGAAALRRSGKRDPVKRTARSGSRAPRWRLAVARVLGPVLGLAGPPAHARSDAVIWEGNDQSVLLAPQDEETAPPNDHPVNLAPRDIEKMLGDLRFRYADQEADAPPAAVFNREQVEILGEALATGLARATPSQDVTFSVVGAHRLSPGALARRNRVTAGRAFFRQGKLNLILGEIQSPYRKKNIYGRIEQDFHPRQYGSRAAPEEQESLLIGTALASLQDGAGGTRHDWAVFDPDLAAADAAPASLPADAGAGRPATSGPRVRPAPAAAERADAAAGRDSPSQGTADAGGEDIEQRLETLKRLRDRDLISEEAYRQKVDEILEDL